MPIPNFIQICEYLETIVQVMQKFNLFANFLLSELSYNSCNFKKAIALYKNEIKQSGYKNDLIFSETQIKKEKSRKNAKSYGSIRPSIIMLSTILDKSF